MDSLRPPDQNLDVEAVHITVRFSASLPDLHLTIDSPVTSTAATLKQQIRKNLPADLADRRLRLIYAGRALIDTSSLSTQLKLSSSRTPSRSGTPIPVADRNDVKGKTAIYDPPARTRTYIHCSIGDVVLSAADLSLEKSQSVLLHTKDNNEPSSSSSSSKPPTLTTSTSPSNAVPSSSTTTTTPAPRGFDRLLSAGFSPAEIRTLRSQFMAIQAHSHTPDTMPSPTTLRAMEDRWLDNDTAGSTGAAAAAGGGGAGIGAAALPGADEDVSGALDDLLWGAVMGFFWPVGCLWWACREEGIWSRRKKWAVVLGVLINAGIGGLRWMS